MGGQIIGVNTRFIVEAAHLGITANLKQIFVADHIMSQQKQMMRFFIFVRIFIGHAAAVGREVSFHPDNGFDPFILAVTKKLNRPVQYAVVGQR